MAKARVKPDFGGSIKVTNPQEGTETFYTRDDDPFEVPDNSPLWECDKIELASKKKPAKKTVTKKKK